MLLYAWTDQIVKGLWPIDYSTVCKKSHLAEEIFREINSLFSNFFFSENNAFTKFSLKKYESKLFNFYIVLLLPPTSFQKLASI